MDLAWSLTAFTLMTRFYNLSIPSYSCWDEVHFGKMAGYYLNHTYFVDVHPPLGKMLISTAGYLSGFDGGFGFNEPGEEYITDEYEVKFYGMRAFCAIAGSLIIPFLYGAVLQISGSQQAAILTSTLVVFDCGILTLSQYILLDPILLLFMSATMYFKAKCSNRMHMHGLFTKYKTKAYLKNLSLRWYCDFVLCGVCLGCTVAVKWTGLFTVAFLGIWSLYDVWILRINKATWQILGFQLFASAMCIIIVPLCVYVLSFVIHFQILSNSGGVIDGFLSSLFQSCLKGNPLFNASMPLYVAYGSIVTLKQHVSSKSGLLHSIDQLYPLEIMPYPYQQVTINFYKDSNNFWEIVKPSDSEINHLLTNLDFTIHSNKQNQVQFLRSRDIVKFRHVRTNCFLHSHKRKAPLTVKDQIVSCHKNSSAEAKWDEFWRIEVYNTTDDGHIETLRTQFQLIHVNTGCFLKSSFKELPAWGDNQFETTCGSRYFSSWNVEQHSHKKQDRVVIPPCQLTFWDKFLESHLAMIGFNYHITDSGKDSSKVWHWPINFKGQIFSRMGEEDLRVYLLGNPLVFYVNFWSIVLTSLLSISRFWKLSQKHKTLSKLRSYFAGLFLCHKSLNTRLFPYHLHFETCMLFFFAWMLHFLPFLAMPRAVYFHHYYPAFLCNCCLSGVFFDMIFDGACVHLAQSNYCKLSQSWIKCTFLFVFVCCIAIAFYLYSSLAYGMTGPMSDNENGSMHGLRILDSWEF